MQSIRLGIIRPSTAVVPVGYYNIQEIGLAKSLIPYGFSTDIFMAGHTRQPDVEIIREKEGRKVRVFRLPYWQLPGRKGFFPNLFSILNRNNYDLLQTHEDSEPISVLTAIYSSIRKTPLVLCQGMYQPYAGKWKQIIQHSFDMIFGPIIKKSTMCTLAKTSAAKQYLCSKGYDNVMVLPPGLDLDNFIPDEPRNWHKEFGLPKNAKIILYVGSLEPRRNISFLIDLAQYLRDRYAENIYFLIAGRVRPGSAYENILLTPKANYVKFIGPIKQTSLRSLFKLGHLFLLASSYEIFGMVILESLYFKVPVISTSTAGAQDILNNNRGGLILNNLDLETWARTIIDLLSDHELLTKLSIAGYENVCKNFTWNVLAPKFSQHYKAII